MSTIKKIQHFVPKAVLRKFNNGTEEQVFVYDKIEDRCFPANISKILAKNFMYNIDKEFFDEQVDPQIIEDVFTIYENTLAKLINDIENEVIYNKYSKNEIKGLMYQFTVIQLIRTPTCRDLIFKAYEEVFSKALTEEYKNFFLLKELIDLHSKDNESIILNLVYQRYEDWEIGINNTSIPFITSDEAVLGITNFSGHGQNLLIYPLTPKHLLMLKKTGKTLHIEDTKVKSYSFSEDEVRNINSLIFAHSTRYVIGNLNFTEYSYFMNDVLADKLNIAFSIMDLLK